jgi:hypothetical protein
MHDPQIGRFFEVDPLSDKYVHNSPYAFSENKVIAHIELEGLETVSADYVISRLKGELAGAVQGFANWIDNTFSGTTKTTVTTTQSMSTTTGSTTSLQTTNTNSTETSTNFWGIMGHIIRNNSSAGNTEPLTKTTSESSTSAGTQAQVGNGVVKITQKNSVDLNTGVETSKTSVEGLIKLKQIPIPLSVNGSGSNTSEGKKEIAVGASLGDGTKSQRQPDRNFKWKQKEC